MYVCMYVGMHVCMNVCTYVFICMYALLCYALLWYSMLCHRFSSFDFLKLLVRVTLEIFFLKKKQPFGLIIWCSWRSIMSAWWLILFSQSLLMAVMLVIWQVMILRCWLPIWCFAAGRPGWGWGPSDRASERASDRPTDRVGSNSFWNEEFKKPSSLVCLCCHCMWSLVKSSRALC